MSVFITWGGERSEAMARALRHWLPRVIQTVDVFMSGEDIDRGADWRSTIRAKLDEATSGIICLTPESLTSPWVLFESGALSKQRDQVRVRTYLLGLEPTDLVDPLAQYQATRANKDETLALVLSVNESLVDEKQVNSEIIRGTFDLMWPDLEAKLNSIPDQPNTELRAGRTTDEKVDELLSLVRGLSRDIQNTVGKSQAHNFRPRIIDAYADRPLVRNAITKEPILDLLKFELSVFPNEVSKSNFVELVSSTLKITLETAERIINYLINDSDIIEEYSTNDIKILLLPY